MTLVHAFISSRLDYCNSLLYGVGDGLLKKLQDVQNAAARVVTVTGTKKFDHITPVLRDLHWLPVRQTGSILSVESNQHIESKMKNVEYKIALLFQ